jgi:hypothetical protein
MNLKKIVCICFVLFFGHVFCTNISFKDFPDMILTNRYAKNASASRQAVHSLESRSSAREERGDCVDLARRLLRQVGERKHGLDSLLCVLDFCRTCIISDVKTFSFFLNRIDTQNSLFSKGTCWEVLKVHVDSLVNIYRARPEVAKKLALLTAFELPWGSFTDLLEEITSKEGGFSHEYTLESALFILHMCRRASNFSEALRALFKENCQQKEERKLLYASCLAGAMANILKKEGKIQEDFFFDLQLSSEEKLQFVINNVKKLLNAYFGESLNNSGKEKEQ